MTALEKIKKYKSFPSTLLINGLTYLGVQIARTLLEQKGLVIILDKYTKENKTLIDDLSKFESFVFVNINGNDDLLKKIKGLNYLVYLENENIGKQSNLPPKDFLKKIDKINTFLEFAVNQNTKVLVTTSLKIHQLSLANYAQKEYDPKASMYTDVEQQRYIEKLCFNLHKKYKLDIRIIRLGEIYGPKFELSKDSMLKALIQQCVKSKNLKIRGDGLEENFIIHINDATYGLVKAIFSPNTNGEVFNLANYEENSTLSLAYALLETNGKASEIKFLANRKKVKPAPLDPTPNLSKIGWKPRIKLVKGLSEIVDLLLTGKYVKKTEAVKESRKKNIFQKIYGFFFITEEQFQLQQTKKKEKKNILDKLSAKTVKKRRIKTEPKLKDKIERKKKEEKQPNLKLTTKSKRQIKLGWKKYAILGIVTLIPYIFLFAPFIGYVSGLTFAGINGYKAVNSLKENNYNDLSLYLERLEGNIEKSQNALQGLDWAYELLEKDDSKKNMDQFLAGIRHLARGGKQSVELIQPMVSYAQNLSLNLEDESDYTEYMEKIHNNAQEFDLAYIELIKANELLSTVNYEFLILNEKQSNDVKKLQEDLFTKIVEYKDFISITPQILGYPNEKNYLIVFQNDFELRSTGGFIGSYATVKINNGKIENIKVDDIYNPDGQLDEYIEPPEPLKTLLGEEHSWAMRDANWDADFPTSARQLEWFYTLETGEEIDGVIAINTNIVQELLEVLEPVTIDDGTVVTKANFFDESEAHHLTFEPGSTQKKDFLGNLTDKLLDKLGEKDNEALLNVGFLVEEMLQERELFIYLNDPAASRIIAKRGWDGGVAQHEGEYLFIVENNLGGNKVNKYIERKIVQIVNLEEDIATHNLTIEYTNNSETPDWPGGTYVNYVQTIIPQDAEIETIEGLRDHQTEDRYSYKLVSGWIDIGYQDMNSYTINYKTGTVINKPVSKKGFEYLIQKQAGIGASYIDLEVTYPNGWSVLQNDSNLTQRELEDKLTYFGLQDEDITVELEFNTE